VSWFPEAKYQKEHFDICYEYDQLNQRNPDMSEEEKFRVRNEFTDRLTMLMLKYGYEKLQAERSRK
jgi:hypothetical protein